MMTAVKSIDERLADSYLFEIEQAIAQAELPEACNKLQDFVEGLAPKLKKETLNVCFRCTNYQRDFRHGLVRSEDAVPIVNALLEVAAEAHHLAVLPNKYRITHELPAPLRSEPKLADNVTPLRPVRHEKAPPPKDYEELRRLRRSHWKSFRGSRPPGETTAFICENLSKRYRKRGFALEPLSFSVCAGQITAIVGRNASGKTTLLRLITGELAPTTGTVEYPLLTQDGAGWKHIKRQIAYISQTQQRWHGTVRHNLNLVAAAHGILGKANTDFVSWHIQRYGLADYEDFTWDELTGGYRTRFELVRALLSRPKLLVLDEPLAQLDVVTRQEFLNDIEVIANSFERPVPVVITSQHLYEIETISNNMIVFDGGKLLYAGALDEVGKNSHSEVYEISINSGEAEVHATLTPLGLQSIEKTIEGYIVRLPANITADSIYSSLYKTFGNELLCFRTITNSTRRLLQRMIEADDPEQRHQG